VGKPAGRLQLVEELGVGLTHSFEEDGNDAVHVEFYRKQGMTVCSILDQ
jgi:hypothetical protein